MPRRVSTSATACWCSAPVVCRSSMTRRRVSRPGSATSDSGGVRRPQPTAVCLPPSCRALGTAESAKTGSTAAAQRIPDSFGSPNGRAVPRPGEAVRQDPTQRCARIARPRLASAILALSMVAVFGRGRLGRTIPLTGFWLRADGDRLGLDLPQRRPTPFERSPRSGRSSAESRTSGCLPAPTFASKFVVLGFVTVIQTVVIVVVATWRQGGPGRRGAVPWPLVELDRAESPPCGLSALALGLWMSAISKSSDRALTLARSRRSSNSCSLAPHLPAGLARSRAAELAGSRTVGLCGRREHNRLLEPAGMRRGADLRPVVAARRRRLAGLDRHAGARGAGRARPRGRCGSALRSGAPTSRPPAHSSRRSRRTHRARRRRRGAVVAFRSFAVVLALGVVAVAIADGLEERRDADTTARPPATEVSTSHDDLETIIDDPDVVGYVGPIVLADGTQVAVLFALGFRSARRRHRRARRGQLRGMARRADDRRGIPGRSGHGRGPHRRRSDRDRRHDDRQHRREELG